MQPQTFTLIFAILTVLAPLAAWAIVRLARTGRKPHTAEARAQRIVSEAQTLSGEIKSALEAHVLESLHNLDAYGQQALQKLQVRYTQEMERHLQQLATTAESNLRTITASLKQRIERTEDELEKQAKSDRERVRAELGALKQRALQRYTQNLLAQLPVIIKTVARQTLTPKDHEHLIRDALHNAEQKLWQKKPTHENQPRQSRGQLR